MNDLVNKINSLSLSIINGIYVFDVVNDFLLTFKYENGDVKLDKKESLSLFLGNLENSIKEEYLKDYMNSISIPKLEEMSKNGLEITKFSYVTKNNKVITNTNSLINYDGNKCVLTISVESSMEINKSDNAKYNSLVESLADSILKIHNLFNMNEKTLSNPNSIQEYIDSIFGLLTKDYPELKKSFNEVAANVSGRSLDTILIVDDDALTRNMIKKIFKDEYNIVMAGNGKEAIEYIDTNSKKGIEESSDHIIGIFLDLTMPVLDGFAVLDYLSSKGLLNRIPVIIISGDYEKETKLRVYNYNIADMLEKPFDFDVVRHRIGNFINLYKSSNSLNNLINNQTESLKDIIDAYIKAYFYDYDESTKQISKYVNALATQVMKDYPDYNLDSSKIEKMASAVMYYDIGFYSIPRKSLMKNGNYNNDDIKFIKNYPDFGSTVVKYVLSLSNDEEYKKYAINICKHCHENYDGTGYPNALVGDLIPIEAQITAIAIAYHNMKKTKIDVRNVMLSKSGTMFNPKLIISLMKILEQIEKL